MSEPSGAPPLPIRGKQAQVLVTGAAGFLGGNLVRLLLAQGIHVRAGIRQNDMGIRGLDVERVPLDVTDPETIRAALVGIRDVYHCAGVVSVEGDPSGLVHDTNVQGTRDLMQACLAAGVRRVVHVSTAHSLSPEPELPIDETRDLVPADHWSAYSGTKAEAERLVLEAVEQGLDVVIVNPSGMFGPFDFKPSHLGQVLVQLHDRSIPAMVNAGYDFVDVRDVAEGMIQAMSRGRKGERYLLTGRYRTLPQLAGLQLQLTRKRGPRLVCPMWIAKAATPLTGLWSRINNTPPLYTRESLRIVCENSIFDTSKARRELDHRPRPIEQTLLDTWKWMALEDPEGPLKSSAVRNAGAL
jgi:dihydroflavonol-4-reductase